MGQMKDSGQLNMSWDELATVINKEFRGDDEMILKFAIQTVFEIALVVLIIYGFIHEDKLIAFEDSLKRRIKKKGAERHVRDSGNRS